jgi:hypothetical protein
MSDRTTENILRLFGVSKFITWQARTEGVGTAVAKQILPPFKFINAVGKDISSAGDGKGLEIVGSIPVVGKLAYWHMGRGTSKRDDLWDDRLRKYKRKYTRVYEEYEEAADKIAYREEHREELREYKRLNKLQGRLNKYRKKINRLKESDREDKAAQIERLENKRTEKIKQYLSKETEK